MSSKLLFDSQPLVILPELAVAIGLNEAIVLQQVHYWCEINAKAKRNYKDGHYWVYNSFKEWQKQFPWWCERTIKSIFSKLEKQNLIISANYNRVQIDRTKWYRVNHDELDAISNSRSGKICTMDNEDITQAIPEINKKNNGTMDFSRFPAEKPVCISAPTVEFGKKDVSGFIEWYFEQYIDYFGYPHPNIKSKQRIRVANKLNAFLEENYLDVDALQDMTYAFFDNVEYSDHNINHFATDGILENRFYEAVF